MLFEKINVKIILNLIKYPFGDLSYDMLNAFYFRILMVLYILCYIM